MPSGAVLITVRSPGGFRVEEAAAHYVSVGVTLPDGARQLRQYSLVNAPGSPTLTFAVKPVDAAAGPAGEVSTYIRDTVRVGDLLDVTLPFGDLPTPTAAPTVLISAGIGITPMIGLLEYLVATSPQARVLAWHADRSASEHPLRDRQRELVDQLPNAQPFPASGNTTVWRTFATKELAKAWTGEESVEDATKAIAEQMNGALADEQ